jgi:hypothetical protein
VKYEDFERPSKNAVITGIRKLKNNLQIPMEQYEVTWTGRKKSNVKTHVFL